MADDDYSAPGGGRERRREPRVEARAGLTVQVLSSKAKPIKLVNLSAGGLSVTSPEQFMPGEVHRITLRFGEMEAPVMRARVIYWRPAARNAPAAQYLIGFTFVGLGEGQRAYVARLVDELTKPPDSTG